MIKEVCVENFEEAIKAQKMGASRIELCENLHVGGTTPSYGTIALCKKYLKIPFFVMIRPRGGNFVYNDIEVEIMKKDIKLCRELGVEGIVFGVLNQKAEINTQVVQELCVLARGMSITFHKAIDECPRPDLAIKHIKMIGSIDRVLTSGGKPTAIEGMEMLKKMRDAARQDPVIIVAGKVTKDNIDEIKEMIPAKEFHGRRLVGDLTQEES
ncbi:copper homeostasis protein CutC [Halosquirtibacter laminarini]|uniref:Copper homeostasis protein CutC n=1 Tax=Halosquirtibacter laminarini TaxID=3374600 RepID=A0AC61NPI1_9BACT|nr:copper homeostasis protein CutC [Prolixibacteraceae bacterium]